MDEQKFIREKLESLKNYVYEELSCLLERVSTVHAEDMKLGSSLKQSAKAEAFRRSGRLIRKKRPYRRFQRKNNY